MSSLEQKRSVIRESGFRSLLLSRWKKLRMQRTHNTYSDDAVRNVIFTFRTIEFCLGKKIFTIRAGITCFLFLCFVRFPKHTSYPCWINVFYVQKIWTLVQITLSKEKKLCIFLIVSSTNMLFQTTSTHITIVLL